MIDMEKMDRIMLDLGFSDALSGTEFLRAAVELYDSGKTQFTTEVYPTLGVLFLTQPASIERNIRHSIERAWERGSWEVQYKYFGYSVKPDKGCPTVSECIARLARVCREN